MTNQSLLIFFFFLLNWQKFCKKTVFKNNCSSVIRSVKSLFQANMNLGILLLLRQKPAF